jgi:glyoxylase-like metal-dependent hydrolase (beta-lactamase superfamily II)
VASTVNRQVNANGGCDPRQPADEDSQADEESTGQVVMRIVDPVVEQVRPGVWSVPVFWPRGPLRYTLAYLLSADDGAVLVDTGWPTDAGWDSLVAGVRQTGHDITDIQDVLVTHSHPDHLGMAARVREASGARIGMHPAEVEHVSLLTRPGAGERTAGWLRARSAPAAETAEIVERSIAGVAFYGKQAAPDMLIDDGSLPVRGLGLRAIWTPGHSPGHLCFHDEDHGLLLTGDHVLPRISPHRFTGLSERVANLLAHHQARLAEIEHAVACEPGASTWRIAELLTWSRGWEQTTGMTRRAAVSETLAHLVHMQGQHRVVNGRPDGVDAWLPGPRAAAGWD